MLQIHYHKIIPYPFAVILDQYFDLEHIAHVHPQTLGECVLVENTGGRIVYDHIWPADRKGRRATSRVEQRYRPPGEIEFEFIAGKHKGTRVHSCLRPHADGTEVNETYFIPRVPNWRIFRWIIAPMVYRQVNRIWEEDLRAGVCIGGWPGVPDRCHRPEMEAWRQPLEPGYYRIGPVVTESLTAVDTPGGKVLIARTKEGARALHPSCPHTGAPLVLGRLEGDCLVCPWHGARFNVNSGQAVAGPTRIPLSTYEVREVDGEWVVDATASTPIAGERLE